MSHKTVIFLAICGLSLLSTSHAVEPPKAATKEPIEIKADYSADLPRIAPLEPEAASASFETAPGYAMQLVACEPLVADPIAFDFDSRGRLWVVEMRDYSEQETEHLGQIAILSDNDGDGRMDQRSTFAKDLSWPTALACWKDGVIVAEPPHLWYLRDTNDDGVMDSREEWASGFGRSNVQGMVNSLRWTVAGNLRGATSSAGADLQFPAPTDPLTLRGRDFEIDPLLQTVSPASGGGQHGLSISPWGETFVCSNSDHLQQVIEIDRYRQPNLPSTFPASRRSIATDGPQAEVFRLSPVEPWRIVRTQLRVSGAVPGAVEGGGRAAGYFTGATGVWHLAAELGYGPDQNHDIALTCDVGSNLVHRKRLVPGEGLFLKGERIDKETELVRSSDIWFRPVQLGDGPDGCLYIADMYREVIEHPKSLPPIIKQHLDLTSGNDRGRIWRLVPTNRPATEFSTNLAALSTAQLVNLLPHPYPWQRRSAMRLLMERSAPETPLLLVDLLRKKPSPACVILAMHLLSRFEPAQLSVVKETVLQSEVDPRVLVQALIALESADPATQLSLQEELVALTETNDPRLQLQLALSATRFADPLRKALLGTLMQKVKKPSEMLTAAVRNAAGPGDAFAILYFESIATVSDEAALADDPWLSIVCGAMVGDSELRKDRERFRRLAQKLSDRMAAESTRRAVLQQLGRTLRREQLIVLLDHMDSVEFSWKAEVSRWAEALHSEAMSPKQQVELATWCRLLSDARSRTWLDDLLDASQLLGTQLAAVDALADRGATEDLSSIVRKLGNLSGVASARALSRLLESPPGTEQLAAGIEAGEVTTSLIGPEQQNQMRNHPRPETRARFVKLLQPASSTEIQVLLAQYEQAVRETKLTADELQTKGHEVFRRHCVACHRIGDEGTNVGPPFGGNVLQKSTEQLLLAILAPSAEVDPKYLGTTVLLTDGRVLSGIVEQETEQSVALIVSGGGRFLLERNEIEQLRRSGKSLMPEGLQQQISLEEMPALLSFLRQSLR